MSPFTPATREWFASAFTEPTEIQRRGWEAIAGGAHALLIAPTGSGKTLAAFLWGIDTLSGLPPEARPGVRVLYVSPLKALVYDVERNLRAPLVGIRRAAERAGATLREIRVDVRTGDTPQRERRQQVRDPAQILVTTPESLFLLLGSRAAETLRTVRTVIVDEVHAVAATKRGTHLALSLERLAALTEEDPQRIGLSATVHPREEIARFLGGDRPVTVVDASSPPHLDLEVVVPVPDMERVRPPVPAAEGGSILGELAANLGELAAQERPSPGERGIWPALYPALLGEIQAHRSTIVFVNSRALCERLARRLNELAGEEQVQAHHGSVSREKRLEIEDALKRGLLRGIVATSSLELGIDMGAVDRVILVESPRAVARGLQRVGRAGHRVGEVSAGRIYPKFRGDLLECAVIASRMLGGAIEALRVPRNPLDVLAQQAVAVCVERPRTVEEIEKLVRRAHPFRELSREALVAVLEMLSGRYPSTDFADLRPLLSWDRTADLLSPRRGAALVSRLNAGTIPDRGSYGVFLGPEGPRIGELDEEMVFETRVGDNVVLGASTWHVEEISRDRVVVTPAPGEPGRLPFWRGEGPGRPLELGRALGAFVRELGGIRRDRAVEWLLESCPVDRFAAENLVAYVFEQRERTSTLPTDRSITVERFRDELGDWRVCILSPFGARVHAPWALALQRTLGARSGFEVQVMYSDDGIVLRLADTEDLPDLSLLFPDPEEVEEQVTEQLADTALFAGLFRENAARALLMPRRRGGRRSPLWAQRLKAQGLLSAVRQYPTFPIVLETYRQALGDVFDLGGLVELLRRVRSREVRVVEVETASASPFARSLVFAYVAAYLYEQDAPLAERKAQALTLDRGLLADLLGQAELRELLDAEVIEEVERDLQHCTEHRRARDADEVHDLLRRLGDLHAREIAGRAASDPRDWLGQLERERRAVLVSVGGEKRWIAAEEAGLYRDALGTLPPAGLPQDFLEPVPAALEALLRRFARTRGPFLTRDAAGRWGLLPAQVEPALRALESSGALVRGEIRPGGSELDWCDTEVLRRLKRRTLARLRREVAPVDASTLGLFLPAWQGLGSVRPGGDGMEEALVQLEGLPLPWSSLASAVLPARDPEFTLDRLDMLAATGRIVWVGRGSLGPRDGRVALYRRERAAVLLDPREPEPPPSDLHRTILEHLDRRGASFLVELEAAVREGGASTNHEDFRAALWDLVWSGRVTNDTFAPLRALGARPRRPSRATRRGRESLAGGRWSLVSTLSATSPEETERWVARAQMLLERYGIVSREAALAEEIPGGFGPLYRVLSTMEEAGRVRRGYFVEGLSGAQFGHAGAIDRLREVRPEGLGHDEEVLLLAAVDPANPYGALLPWPKTGGEAPSRPRRVAGAWVVLAGGVPVLYLAPGGRALHTFPTPRGTSGLEAGLRALHRLPRVGRRALLLLEKVDGVPITESPHRDRLLANGFVPDYRGVVADPNWPDRGVHGG